MRYYANPTPAARDAMLAGLLGFIDTPRQRARRDPGIHWCADNGCYSRTGWVGYRKWFEWLEANAHDRHSCTFATAPDVVGDAAATLERSGPWLPRIRAAGYPAALVAQDGLENLPVPWDDFDALFIGGTTRWKLSPAARDLAIEAKTRHGKHVHLGRANSLKRLTYAHAIGADSADGTYLVFGPEKNLPRLLGFLRLATAADLFGAGLFDA